MQCVMQYAMQHVMQHIMQYVMQYVMQYAMQYAMQHVLQYVMQYVMRLLLHRGEVLLHGRGQGGALHACEQRQGIAMRWHDIAGYSSLLHAIAMRLQWDCTNGSA